MAGRSLCRSHSCVPWGSMRGDMDLSSRDGKRCGGAANAEPDDDGVIAVAADAAVDGRPSLRPTRVLGAAVDSVFLLATAAATAAAAAAAAAAGVVVVVAAPKVVVRAGTVVYSALRCC